MATMLPDDEVDQGWRRPLAVALGFILIALAVMAGALGVSVAVAVTAILALPPWRDLRRLFPLDLAHSVLLIFIAWMWISTLWSPYPASTQALTLALGAFVYPLFVYDIVTLKGRGRKIVIVIALISALAMILPYLLEATTGIVSRFFAAGAERQNMLRDATRGIAAIIMATPALAVLLMQNLNGQKGKIAAGLLVLLMIFITARFHLFAGVLAMLSGCILFAAGYRWPRSTILIATLGFLIMLLMAPMIMPVFAAPLDGMDLPLSWEWRVKMWPYTGSLINVHPLMGWGLDASRTFSGDHFELRGFSLPYLVNHPHNLGLQVWLETGLIGALILSIALALFGLRIGSARYLSAVQGAAISATAGVYLVFFSITYGAWQDWSWASIAWVAGLLVLIAPSKPPGSTI